MHTGSNQTKYSKRINKKVQKNKKCFLYSKKCSDVFNVQLFYFQILFSLVAYMYMPQNQVMFLYTSIFNEVMFSVLCCASWYLASCSPQKYFDEATTNALCFGFETGVLCFVFRFFPFFPGGTAPPSLCFFNSFRSFALCFFMC